ncbi:peptidase [Yersinia entomophaga]|uniref:Peptidase n=1 Tax=Yersinia entomophaga TaxID=935293 RepID=A0ABM6BJC8_YERET|nr:MULTISPECIES: type I secretion system permease/ATPase [Yersinia]ANI29711.1 peptidase [Yersinia entomophaga]OWF87193.1 type I secretion system permease/ATPase [Yersinia entomophaga]
MPLANTSQTTLPPILAVLICDKTSLWGIGIFTAIINLLMLAPAIYMLQVYERVLASANTMTLLMLTLLVLGAFALIGLLEWVRGAVVIRLGTRADMQLNQQVFNSTFQSILQGNKIQAAQALNDLTTLRQFATGNALFAIFDAPWFPFYLLVIYLLHPWLGAMATIGAGVLILLACTNHWACKKPLKQASEITSRATLQANAHLRNADTIAAMGMLKALRERWLTQHCRFLYLQNIASDRSSRISALAKSSKLTLQSMMLGLGSLLVIRGEITAGVMIAGSILIGRVLGPIDQLIAVWKHWSHARLAYQRLTDLLANQQSSLTTEIVLPDPLGQLTVTQLLACRAGTSVPILHSVNFTLQPGEVLGVLGPSGSGKSTLARLLVASQTAFSGSIRLDGAEISHWNKSLLGKFIGYLPQDVQLFQGSVAENIARFGVLDSSQIVAAAKMADVHDLILHLPKGYDTQLGDGGEGLSGGQSQRIALARAMYGMPRLIVLDEPNASLDEGGEKALLASIEQLKRQGSTVVMITHKPELLSGSDFLLLLKNGQQQLFDRTAAVLSSFYAKDNIASTRKADKKNVWGNVANYRFVPAGRTSQGD